MRSLNFLRPCFSITRIFLKISFCSLSYYLLQFLFCKILPTLSPNSIDLICVMLTITVIIFLALIFSWSFVLFTTYMIFLNHISHQSVLFRIRDCVRNQGFTDRNFQWTYHNVIQLNVSGCKFSLEIISRCRALVREVFIFDFFSLNYSLMQKTLVSNQWKMKCIWKHNRIRGQRD